MIDHFAVPRNQRRPGVHAHRGPEHAGVRGMHDEPGRIRPRPRPPTRPRPTQRAAVLQLNLCHSGIAGCFIGDDVMLKAWLFADDELALKRCSQDEESLGILRRIPFPENLDRRVGQLLTRPRRRPRTWLTGGKNNSGSGIVRCTAVPVTSTEGLAGINGFICGIRFRGGSCASEPRESPRGAMHEAGEGAGTFRGRGCLQWGCAQFSSCSCRSSAARRTRRLRRR